jgi:ABC-type branched-subunit amino acid transport system ATPase component
MPRGNVRAQLISGRRPILAISQALIAQPKVLILDEPPGAGVRPPAPKPKHSVDHVLTATVAAVAGYAGTRPC